MTVTPGAPSLEAIHALYEQWGSDTYDEELSQLAHALQTAALARVAGAADELVVAALLHDVGHLLALEADSADGTPVDSSVDLVHEAVGARYLARLFPPAVTGPVALHVRAKRYRGTVEPAYLAGLSAGSTASLAKQGGLLAADEVALFEAMPGFADALALRGWDDGGKLDGLDVPGWESYCDLLRTVAFDAI